MNKRRQRGGPWLVERRGLRRRGHRTKDGDQSQAQRRREHLPDNAPPVVRTERRGSIALVLIDNPPVNATSQAVRQGLASAIEAADADPSVEAIVIACEGRTF